jgi:hypothetical protein
MFSSFVKFFLVIAGLSPALLGLYLVKLFRIYGRLSIYLRIGSVHEIKAGLVESINDHLFLIVFVLIGLSTIGLVYFAKKRSSVGRIAVKSIKPADFNFLSSIFSVILPVWKFYDPSTADKIFLLGYLIMVILYAAVVKGSYHYNLFMKLFLRYNHYEVQTVDDVTYLVLSKHKLINKGQLTQYIYLTDSMLLNVSKK